METSPNFLPGPQPEHPTSLKIIFAVLAIGLMAGGYYFFYYRFLPSQESSNETTQKNLSQIGNPIEYFYQHFSEKDYRVKVSDSQNDNNIISYYKQGKLFRIDWNTTYSNATIIFKDGKVYTLDHREKTYVEAEQDHPFMRKTISVYRMLSTIDFLLASEHIGATAWERVGENGASAHEITYITKGREISTPEGSFYSDLQIVLDKDTGLIMSLTDPTKKDIEAKFEYQTIDDEASLKQFPNDYKKKDLITSLYGIPAPTGE